MTQNFLFLFKATLKNTILFNTNPSIFSYLDLPTVLTKMNLQNYWIETQYLLNDKISQPYDKFVSTTYFPGPSPYPGWSD